MRFHPRRSAVRCRRPAAVRLYDFTRRSPEMGIQIALGADLRQLIHMVMREMRTTVTVGLAVGIGLAMLAAPALAPVLYEVPAADTLATYLPARRASAVNPVVAGLASSP